jgi:hypothetical protein
MDTPWVSPAGKPGWRRPLRVLMCVFGAVAAASASGGEAMLKRQAPLRSEPSTNRTPLLILEAQEAVDLLDPAPSSGYYHVRTRDGDEGWVFSGNLDISASSRPPPAR